MDDLISRQAAIDTIKALWNDAPSAQHVSAMFDCEDAIRALPSAQPEPQWIPYSERPPKEEDGRVLITLDGEVTTATYSEFSKTWYIGDMCGVSNRVPTAWMPRPKPYRSK